MSKAAPASPLRKHQTGAVRSETGGPFACARTRACNAQNDTKKNCARKSRGSVHVFSFVPLAKANPKPLSALPIPPPAKTLVRRSKLRRTEPPASRNRLCEAAQTHFFVPKRYFFELKDLTYPSRRPPVNPEGLGGSPSPRVPQVPQIPLVPRVSQVSRIPLAPLVSQSP